MARPSVVWLCLLPVRLTPRETWFICWVGLRGPAPIVPALFSLLAQPAALVVRKVADGKISSIGLGLKD